MTPFPKGLITFLGIAAGQPLGAPQCQELRRQLRQRGAAHTESDGGRVWAAFSAPIPAVTAALQLQRWQRQGGHDLPPLALALHRSASHERTDRTAGPALRRMLHILDAAHPGQIVVSATLRAPIDAHMADTVTLRDQGTHRLRDLLPPIQLLHLVAPDMPAAFPPLPTLDTRPHNLPVLLTPLIGRTQEVAAIGALLRDPGTRILTVRGVSGAGKTRLALQVAVDQIDWFADGVYVVSLAPITDPTLVLSEIAQRLGMKEQGATPLLTTLAAELASRQLLVVLDNVEQVSGAMPLLAPLLAAAPGLRLLVTSQVACNLAHERLFDLPPLALPPADTLPSLSDLGQIPAVALFVERARAVQPAFVIDDRNAAAILALCHNLEGLPLAIELVAGQSHRYEPGDMLVLLNIHLTTVRATLRGDSRRDIVRPVLDWICEILGTPATTFFARLGVFAGGCTPESATAIGQADDLGLDATATLDLLRANHLLLREELIPGQVRHTMLDAVHEYARIRLHKHRDHARVHQAHAAYYAALADAAAPHLLGATQRAWRLRLTGAQQNIRAALAWSAIHSPPTLVRLSGAMARFWFLHAHYREGDDWLQRALMQLGASTPDLQARVLHGLGILAYARSDYALAITHLEAALAIHRALGDDAEMINTLNYLGNTASNQHHVDHALRYYMQGLERADKIDHHRLRATLTLNIGVLHYYEADFAAAHRAFAACLAIHHTIDNAYGRSIVLNNLGLIAYHTGDVPQAQALFQQSLAIAKDLDNPLLLADTFGNLARVAIAAGELAAGRHLLEQATALRETQAERFTLALTLEVWADLALAEHQPGRAIRLAAMAHALFQHEGTSLAPLAMQQRARVEAAARPMLSAADYAASRADISPQLPLHAVFAAIAGVGER